MFDLKSSGETIDEGNLFAEAAAPRTHFINPRPAAPPAERYGAHKGVNLPVVLVILAIHAVLLVALVQMRTMAIQKKEAALAVVNLMPPAAPPSEEKTPPPPSRPDIVVPPPLVHTPVPALQPVAVTDLPVIKPTPVSAATAPAPAPAPPAVPAVVQAGDLSTRMIAGKPPRYPVDARRKREQGTVILGLVIGLDGRVESVTIAQSSGFPSLDNAARDAARNWRWEPVIRDGQPVRVKGSFDVPFALKG
jgi:protein TonB